MKECLKVAVTFSTDLALVSKGQRRPFSMVTVEDGCQLIVCGAGYLRHLGFRGLPHEQKGPKAKVDFFMILAYSKRTELLLLARDMDLTKEWGAPWDHGDWSRG